MMKLINKYFIRQNNGNPAEGPIKINLSGRCRFMRKRTVPAPA